MVRQATISLRNNSRKYLRLHSVGGRSGNWTEADDKKIVVVFTDRSLLRWVQMGDRFALILDNRNWEVRCCLAYRNLLCRWETLGKDFICFSLLLFWGAFCFFLFRFSLLLLFVIWVSWLSTCLRRLKKKKKQENNISSCLHILVN